MRTIILLLLAVSTLPAQMRGTGAAGIKVSRLANRHAIPGLGLVAGWDLTGLNDSVQSIPALNTTAYPLERGSTSGADSADPAVGTAGLVFDGGDDVLSSPNISLDSSLTIMAVLYPTDNDTAEIILHNTAAAGAFESWRDNATYSALRGYGISYVTGAALPINAWSLHTGTVSATTGKVYKNGALVSTGSVGEAGSAISAPVTIGRSTSVAFGFGGTIALPLIYSRALSAAEIARTHRALQTALTRQGVTLL